MLGNIKIITFDGPSASGKGTVAKSMAQDLKFQYLDSGILYRYLAYSFLELYPNTNFKYTAELLTIFANIMLEFDSRKFDVSVL